MTACMALHGVCCGQGESRDAWGLLRRSTRASTSSAGESTRTSGSGTTRKFPLSQRLLPQSAWQQPLGSYHSCDIHLSYSKLVSMPKDAFCCQVLVRQMSLCREAVHW